MSARAKDKRKALAAALRPVVEELRRVERDAAALQAQYDGIPEDIA